MKTQSRVSQGTRTCMGYNGMLTNFPSFDSNICVAVVSQLSGLCRGRQTPSLLPHASTIPPTYRLRSLATHTSAAPVGVILRALSPEDSFLRPVRQQTIRPRAFLWCTLFSGIHYDATSLSRLAPPSFRSAGPFIISYILDTNVYYDSAHPIVIITALTCSSTN